MAITRQRKDNQSVKLLGKAPAICSGKKTADAIIFNGKSVITSVILGTDGANDASLVVTNHNSTSGSGTTFREFTVTATDNFGGNAVSYPIYCDVGIRAEVTGTGAYYFIDYLELEQ